MGLFRSLFESTLTVLEFNPSTIQEAYISVLYPVANSDGEMSDEEIEKLSPILISTGLFEDINVGDLIRKAAHNIEKFGAKKMIESSLKIINQKYKPQLFCFCAEIVLSDGVVTEEEEQILEYLARAAMISDDTAKKIIEVTMIRAGI